MSLLVTLACSLIIFCLISSILILFSMLSGFSIWSYLISNLLYTFSVAWVFIHSLLCCFNVFILLIIDIAHFTCYNFISLDISNHLFFYVIFSAVVYNDISSLWRCPWCNGYRRRNWTRRHEFKSWTRLIPFHIAVIPLGKVWIQLFSLQLWVNSRAD